MANNITFVLEISKQHKIEDVLQTLQKILIQKEMRGMGYKIIKLDRSKDELVDINEFINMPSEGKQLQNWKNLASSLRSKARAGITALVSAKSEGQIKKFIKLLRKERITFKIKPYTED